MKYLYSLLLLLPLPFLSAQLLGSQSPLRLHQPASPDNTTEARLTTALTTWQTTFFNTTVGTWPTAIDWTSAFLGTLLAATTRTHPSHLPSLLSFFHGQNAASLREQAFDDILWVVLNWLEALDTLHALPPTPETQKYEQLFTARALEFYTLAETGWDVSLCGGGMIWSPWLEPYKNAITNELYISASMRMYEVFPRNESYLHAAQTAYSWLQESRMQKVSGLWADGYHVSGLDTGGKVCDILDEQVYTYNQGVLLTGLRGLYDVTGDPRYLRDGVALVEATIRKGSELERDGVLTERCDPGGYCSQNGHMFKGIWMHHLVRFCGGEGVKVECARWGAFVRMNAGRAWETRNLKGVGGSWWGAPAGKEVAELDVKGLEMGEVDRENACATPDWRVCEMAQRPEGWKKGDLNDRGRGRTVESHAGLVAALRAAVEIGNEVSG